MALPPCLALLAEAALYLGLRLGPAASGTRPWIYDHTFAGLDPGLYFHTLFSSLDSHASS